MSNRFTEKAEKALNNAVRTAENFGHTYIGSEHILLSLSLAEESTSSVILRKNYVTSEKIENAIKEYSGTGLKSSLTPKDMTPCSKKIIENSYRISVKYNAQRIGTEHILLAILEEKESVAVKLFSYIGADTVTITDEIQTLLRCADKNNLRKKDGKDISTPLKQHGKNLTEYAREGKLDPVIGRDKETERLIRILCRKNKNNPCLIGEAGVGKTAIVEGLAIRIANGSVPPLLRDKEIICVDLTSMVSGTKYRGDFEERIKSVLQEAAKNKSIILFIDEIHTIVGAGAAEGAIDAANILKPQLSRGEIQLIGATTFNEYHKYIEKDGALERRFQPITVEETTYEQTSDILFGLKDKYELHHNVKITESAIKACVNYSTRYIQDRFLPDKALDVLDEACAMVASSQDESKKEITETDNKLRQIELEKDDAIKNGDFILAKNLMNVYNFLLKEKEELSNFTVPSTPIVKEKDIKEIINEITGIPIIGIGKRIDKNALFQDLCDVIIGQEDAINKVCSAISRSESGISDPDRPKGVFLFVGGSGVGKSELAKEIAKKLFFDKKSFLKYDMSEFSESNSVTKLIGSPPGYVGHDDGGALTEKVRRHPYSIILFDEVEKAHSEVIDLFLQITDTGIITDSSGRSVSLKNCYIIFTSNIGSSALSETSLGFVSKNEYDVKKRVYELLYERFRVEFINRIDEVVVFSPISNEAMIKIAHSKLELLRKRLINFGVNIAFSEEIPSLLASKADDEKLGVRNLKRIISTEIEAPLADFINQNSITGELIEISSNGEKIKFLSKEKCTS